LERNFALRAAGRADGVIHFARASAGTFPFVAAGLASLGLICEALFFKEILFACCEDKLLSTVFTNDCFILMFQLPYLVSMVLLG